MAQCYTLVNDVSWAGWDGQAMVATVQSGEHGACPVSFGGQDWNQVFSCRPA